MVLDFFFVKKRSVVEFVGVLKPTRSTWVMTISDVEPGRALQTTIFVLSIDSMKSTNSNVVGSFCESGRS